MLGKYFKKQINLKQFGVSEIVDLIKLAKADSGEDGCRKVESRPLLDQDTVAISEDECPFACLR